MKYYLAISKMYSHHMLKKTDGTGGYYVKRNKPESKRQV